MTHEASEYPEDYLWVRDPDGRLTIIDQERLWELADGAEPKRHVEELLVANPDWLRIYLRHALGECPIAIPAGGPLPDWNEDWVRSVES